jgi:hypothetical protein
MCHPITDTCCCASTHIGIILQPKFLANIPHHLLLFASGNAPIISKLVGWGYRRLRRSMVTCRCRVSYNSSFSRRSKRASFSRLEFLPLLEGLHPFSVLAFLGVVSAESPANFPALFRLPVPGETAISLISLVRRDRPFDLRARLVSGSPSDSSSVLNSSYAFSVTVRFRPLRRALSSSWVMDAVTLRCFVGGWGSKISWEADVAGRFFAEEVE